MHGFAFFDRIYTNEPYLNGLQMNQPLKVS
jgi:hypothetical protein